MNRKTEKPVPAGRIVTLPVRLPLDPIIRLPIRFLISRPFPHPSGEVLRYSLNRRARTNQALAGCRFD